MADQPKLEVLMTGPLPPAVGGMATLIGDLSKSSLGERASLTLFNTGKTTSSGRPWHRGVAARMEVIRRWWQLLRMHPGAVVHIHTCSGLTFFLDGILLLIARWLRHPLVLHVHGGFFDQFLDRLRFPLSGAARYIARSADRLVVLSEEWRNKLSKRLPGASIVVVENGIPLGESPSLSGNRESGPIRVLFLGGLSLKKGLLELAQAVSGLSPDVRLVIAGAETEQGFGERLREECRKLGIENRTEFAGQVSGRQKAECFSNADLFALPSYAEGLPISLLEAMAAGLPVVVSSVGGIPSVVQDGVHGRLIPSGEVQPLRDAIAELAADSRKRREMGQAGRQRVVERFDIESAAQSFMQIYRSITNPGATCRHQVQAAAVPPSQQKP